MIKNFRLFVLLLICFASTGCKEEHHEAEVSGTSQGMSYHIKLVLDNHSSSLEEIRRQISTSMAEIDSEFSKTREDSEISRINRYERVDWFPVSKEIIQLLVIAEAVNQRAEGCFDLTLKPLSDLWGFSGRVYQVPSDHEIEELLPHIGMSLLEIDAFNQRIRKADPKLKIDLTPIAKGYSLAILGNVLDVARVQNYMIEFDGEMKVKGRKANGENWRVGVETPTPSARTTHKIIEIKERGGATITTAGTFRDYFEEKGQTYSNILNPETGKPINHHLRSVTVIHDDPVMADAWDTALLCLGEEDAIRIAEEENLKVLLLYDKDKKLKEFMSKAFVASQ